jgi:hypothetical protein
MWKKFSLRLAFEAGQTPSRAGQQAEFFIRLQKQKARPG